MAYKNIGAGGANFIMSNHDIGDKHLLSMIDLTFAEYLEEKRGSFHTYFFWPVYRNGNLASKKVKFDRLEGHFFKVRTSEVSVSNKEMVNFGTDFIYQELSNDFGVAFGSFAKKGPKDNANSMRILESLGLIPIRFEKALLFEFLRNPLNYGNYRLREYRGKAERRQSYFKDDVWDEKKGENAILKRLTEDAQIGIKPYLSTFKSLERNGYVKVFESGAILTDEPKKNLNFIEDIIEKMIMQGKNTVALAKKVKVEHLKKAISLWLHTDMLIEIEETNSHAIDSFIHNLEFNVGVYGIWRESNKCFMNIQYEKQSDDSRDITSAFSVSIEPTHIIATPTNEPSLKDTLSFFYDVDRHFEIKREKG